MTALTFYRRTISRWFGMYLSKKELQYININALNYKLDKEHERISETTEMIIHRPTTREAGDRLVVAQAQRQVQTFFDELKNGTLNYRTISSLNEQIAQAYRGRCILELLQNAHDALANPPPDDPRQISFLLSTRPEPVLLIANSGHPVRPKDFEGLCQLGQSPKDPNESVGNKGLGFRSVLEVSAFPEIWSTAPHGSDTSFVFRFDPSVPDHVAAAAREIRDKGLAARSPFDAEHPLLD